MRVSIFIILAALLISCNNTGAEPEETFKPYQIGAWTLTRPYHAEYSGINKGKEPIKEKQDTIVITKPGDQNMTLDSLSGDFFKLTFIDSTLKYPESDIDIRLTEIQLPLYRNQESIYTYHAAGGNKNLNRDRFLYSVAIEYACGYADVPENPIMSVTTFHSDSSVFKYYEFRIDSLNVVAQKLACH